jgi:hypothetical protein
MSQPGVGPGSVVGKFASEDPTSRVCGHQSGLFCNEVCFYQDLARLCQ